MSNVTEIYTTGFPRSGNTWTDRLLSDLLRAPLQSLPGAVEEYFGPEKDGDYVIRKTHFYAHQYSEFGYAGDPSKMVWVQRDPRDMIVSIMYYRGVEPDLMSTMLSVVTDTHIGIESPVPVAGYRPFMEGWLNTDKDYFMIRYEHLSTSAFTVMLDVYAYITGDTFRDDELYDWVGSVVERQEFSKWADKYNHSMRKGIVGDWKNHFKREHGKIMTDHVGDLMLSQGYIKDLDWWMELPE